MAAILNLGLNIVFVPYMGVIGAAITTLLAFAFAFILTAHYSFRYITFDVDYGIFGAVNMMIMLPNVYPGK